MMALLLTMFLFVLGLGLLYFLDRDSRAGLNLQRSQQAQAAAQSGISYARSQAMTYSSTGILAIPTTPSLFYSLDATNQVGFTLLREGANWWDCVIYSEGQIRDTDGKVLARRTLGTRTLYPSLMLKNSWDADL